MGVDADKGRLNADTDVVSRLPNGDRGGGAWSRMAAEGAICIRAAGMNEWRECECGCMSE